MLVYLLFLYFLVFDLSKFKIEADSFLANKVITTGDAPMSGNLEVQRLYITNSTAGPIEINNRMHNGPYLAAISQNHSNSDLLFALRCLPLNQSWCSGASTSNQYIISHGNSTKLSIQSNGSTPMGGNLDVGSTGNNSIKVHGTGVKTVCTEFTINNGQNCVWDFISPNGGNMLSNI